MADTWVMLLGYGLVDALNPASIVTVLLLLPNARHRWHVTVFIAGTYLTYLLLGLASVYGLNEFVAGWVTTMFNRYRLPITYTELGAGVGMLIAFVICLLHPQGGATEDNDRHLSLPRTTAGYVVLLAIGSTLQDFPTAVPYFGFIVALVAKQYPVLIVTGLLALYVIVYVSPMVVLQLTYNRFESRFAVVAATIQRWTGLVLRWSIVVVLATGGLILVWNALTRLYSPV